MQTTQHQHQPQAGPTLPPLRPHPQQQQQQHQQQHHHHHHHHHAHHSPYQSGSPQTNNHHHSASQSPPLTQKHQLLHQQNSQESNPNWHNHLLKRTASRAELDRRQEQFTHSHPPPPLPTRESNRQSNAHQDERTFVKPEYHTPHLPPQPLPTPPNHNSPQLPCHSPSVNHSPDQPAQQLQEQSSLRPASSIKKRRMTIADEGSLAKTTQANRHLNHHPGESRTQNKKVLQSESATEPISPLVIGFSQPDDPTAIQQVANTIKLREEQKRLIEQRRNSFAGLNSFSFSSHIRAAQPSSQNDSHRYSPGSIRARTSISKPVPPSSNNNNGLMKLLSHPNLPTTTSSNQPSQQSAYDAPPPVVNLPSIDPEASRKPVPDRHQHPVRQPQQSIPDPTPSPDSLDVSSPTQASSQNGPGSSVADRRGQAVREKVKNMAFALQAFRPQLLGQPSVQSAPIRNGFLQATAPNGEVVKTPLIARTNLAGAGATGSNNPTQPSEIHPARFTKLNHSSRLHHSIAPGPSTAHPKLGASEGPYRQGIERRMTMHSDSLMQVPTLSHLVPGSNNGLSQSQPNPGGGRPSVKSTNSASHQNQSIPLIPGPPNPITSSYPNNNHHYHSQSQSQQQQHPSHVPDGLRNCGPPHGQPSQPTFQDQLPPPGSARLRGGPGQGPPGGIPSKQMFLQLFESFYDSLSDSKVLQNNLEEQIRRSAQLLHSLQQSAGVFEATLDDRLAAVQTQSTRELQILENRIDLLEARLTSSNDDELHHHPLEMAATTEKGSMVPNGSPKIPLSTDSSAKSTSQTSTGGGPRSGTGVEDGHRTE